MNDTGKNKLVQDLKIAVFGALSLAIEGGFDEVTSENVVHIAISLIKINADVERLIGFNKTEPFAFASLKQVALVASYVAEWQSSFSGVPL